jgi:enolase-phosphatase E1
VHRTLFGHARAHLAQFLERHWDDAELRADIARLRAEHAAERSEPAPPAWRDDAAAAGAYLAWLMDQDRKSTALKSIQGKIWEEGYRSGELRGEVYADVPAAFHRWRSQGIDLAIFSSGSVQAQRSLFRSSVAGDLSRFIRAYFDTTTGPKQEPESYVRIAAALERSPSDVLFLSDVSAELDAARAAGMQTALTLRAGSTPGGGGHIVIESFDSLQ